MNPARGQLQGKGFRCCLGLESMEACVRGCHQIQITAFVLFMCLSGLAGTAFKATTTLTAETSNNTSAADTFTTQTDGNNGAGNISKAPTRNLLYSGSTAKIYAHLMLWFGPSSHMNVGYTSDDAIQIHKQITDMVSRGLDGAIIDWYGQGATSQSFANINQATQYVMNEAALHPNFFFAVMDDAGSLGSCAKTAGCDITQTLINDLTYAYNNYENSTAYLRYNNRPVVYFFGQESYTIDWNRVRTSVPGNPLFIFRNAGGFNYAQSNGAFSWVAPETVSSTDPMGLNYLDNFDQTSLSYTSDYSLVSGYKGFNDTLAAWGTGRIINQNCGQTWIQSIAQSAKYYSSSKQMLGIQLVTWNDYEEGTEIESGIDNCVTVTGSATGTVASWTIAGQSSTIDHYTVFLSQDGENLMWLADLPSTATSLDLAQFSLNSGNYTVFVKATGKPSMTNKMSAGISLTIPNLPPGVVLNVSPTSGAAALTVNASTSGSNDPDGSIASTVINFGDGSVPVSAVSASHIYTTGGTFTVSATATDNLGATSSKTVTVTVTILNLPPVAALSVSPTSGYGPLAVSASTSGSYDPDGTVAGSSINFGDGTGAAGPTASHTYSAAGTYTITATVTDNSGSSSSTSTSVTVKTPEVIVTSPAAGAITISPVQVAATGFSGFPVTTMQIYLDGALSYAANSATLNTTISVAPGSHTLVIKGWDSSGRSFMKSVNITIDQPVAAISLSPGTILVGGSVTASTAGSSDPYGSIVTSQIDFGDGTIVPAASAAHQYRTAGTYTVKATVTDNLGASSTASTTVTVKPQYVVISSPTGGTITTSSVQVIGTAFSGYPVVSTQVYLDGALKYQTSASSVNISLAIPGGTHRICVQGWDSSGATFKAFVSVTR
jgi:PKD repeat protein